MIIKSITLNNYRLYKGENTLSLSSSDETNIVLISGENGFGKTTFLHSLIWCLYGKLMIEVEVEIRKDINSNGYNSFLRSNMNNDVISEFERVINDEMRQSIKKKGYTPEIEHLRTLTTYSVTIEFSEVVIPSLPCTSIKISRFYDIIQDKESVEILIDGVRNELANEIGPDVFINDFILNKDIARFFFFDSEQIVALAETGSVNDRRKLCSAYNEVLGVRKYEDLKRNLENVRLRFRRKSSDTEGKEKLQKLLDRQEALNNNMDENKEKASCLETEIKRLREQDAEYQLQLMREGQSTTISEISRLEALITILKAKDEDYKKKLKVFMDYAPIAIVGKLFNETKAQLEKDYKKRELANNQQSRNLIVSEITSDMLLMLTRLPKELMDISQKVKRKKTVNYAIVSTYDSFVNKDFQYLLPILSENMILIADEAHNIGGKSVKECFRNLKVRRRIALSATPERIYDEEGSKDIASFFNDSHPYVYSFPMSKAINEGRLCKYYYYPKLAYLNDGEMRLYSRISKRLAQLWDSENGKFKNKQEAEMLLMNRKRIIHKCSDKLNVFREIISEIGKDDLRYTFVYAPQGKYEKMGIDDEVTLTEEDDMSFIQRLLNEAKMMYPNKRCNTFTGMDSKDKRSLLLKSFADGNLDILFAMKCLDEGVDIPRAERGIFTSSTGNPREFIQRRGRLLRNHPDKMFSYIYDIVVIPATINREDSFGQMERNMVKSELKRVAYFASLSMNCHANNGAFEILNDLAHHFGIVWSELLEKIEQ